jgi:uncharacterized membrane protein YhaH (DUF805 family)
MEFDVNKAIQYFQDVVTNHYSDFNGRVPRKDYWTYIAVYFVAMIGGHRSKRGGARHLRCCS